MLLLDLAGEYTIYFGDWHGHYYKDEINDMREFRQVLEDLLDSKICSVGCFRERDGVENWCGSSIEFRENIDRDYFQRKYGGDRIIRCRFFDEITELVCDPGEDACTAVPIMINSENSKTLSQLLLSE